MKFILRRGIDEVLSRAPRSCGIPWGLSIDFDFKRLVPSGHSPVVIDAGANIGVFSRRMARIFPTARIYAVEPGSAAFDVLQRTFEHLDRVQCRREALGAVSERRSLFVSKDTEQSTFVSTVSDLQRHNKQEDVRVITLEQVAALNKIEKIDLLKMDVQGWELEVLKGAKSLLASRLIRLIYTEVSFNPDDKGMVYVGDIIEALSKFEFKFCGLYERNRCGSDRAEIQFANALFICRGFSD